MTEQELIFLWMKARWHIIISQLAPTFLLTATVWFLMDGLGDAAAPVRLAAAGILLASGLLGAAAQIASATEGLAVLDDLQALSPGSRIATRIVASRPAVALVRLVSPAIFVLVYLAILWALFL